MIEAIRQYCVRQHQPVPESRGELVRCIFESLALRYREVIEALRGLSPTDIQTLHVIGGGSRNALLCQWTANAVGMPVVAGPAEATGIGNIMVQAMAAHVAEDIQSMRRLIHDQLELTTYQPAEVEKWDDAFLRYKEVTGK